MKLTIIPVLSVFLFSCSSTLCGELTGAVKAQLENAKAKAPNLKIENIPCEFYYMNVTVTTKNVDTAAIHAIHPYLYNQKTKTGWAVLLVHDAEGKYLFSHNYTGNIFIQTGD